MINVDPPARIPRPWAPVAGMFALVHAAFLLSAVLRNADATSHFTIRTGADAFYFGWLFAVPLLLELLVVGWPLTRLVSRMP